MKNSTYFLAVQIQSEGHKQLGAVLQAFSNPSCKGYEPWELHLLPLTVEHVFNHFSIKRFFVEKKISFILSLFCLYFWTKLSLNTLCCLRVCDETFFFYTTKTKVCQFASVSLLSCLVQTKIVIP